MISATQAFLTLSHQVHWLLLALSQDGGKPRAVADALREACERAALGGNWVRKGHQP
jgi:hypothetical protein